MNDPLKYHKLVERLNKEIEKIDPEETNFFRVRSYIDYEEIEFVETRFNCMPFGPNLCLDYLKANLLVMRETIDTAIQAVENLEKENVE